MICRFVDSNAGQVSLYGKDVKCLTGPSLSGALSVVPQDVVLFNDTLFHNIAYGDLSAPREKVLQALSDAQLDGLVGF
jgi:ABC-type transport system involved in Fe-S cluster assembly fused permease/ATPase subunit